MSISTVSQVINRPGRVNPQTRDRVLKAVEDLQYVPKAAAVSSARQGVGRIGVLAPFTSYDSYRRRLMGVLAESDGTSRDVVVYDHESAAASLSPLLRILPVTGRLDGLLIMGLPLDDALAEKLLTRRLPTVLVDSSRPEFHTVNDRRRGGRRDGRPAPARSAGTGRSRSCRSRRSRSSSCPRASAATAASCARSRPPAVDPDAVPIVLTSNDIAGSRKSLPEVLARRPRPTAVFAHHDLLAAGLLLECRRLGVRVPDDLAVVGFDDGSIAEAAGLTTVRQPFEESGRLGARLLGDMLAGTVRSRCSTSCSGWSWSSGTARDGVGPPRRADRRRASRADLVLPAGAGPVPAVVALMPYRVDALGGAGCWATLRRFAAAGYGCVLVDCRGLGSSDGPARAPFDPAEADDGVAAVEWAAAQPWCDGTGRDVGLLLGRRAGAADRDPAAGAAARGRLADGDARPGAGLRASRPAARGMVGPLAVWGVGTLVNQLLPPLAGFHDPDEQRRWRRAGRAVRAVPGRRGRHPPGDPVWRSRTVDASAVTVPTLSVGGWRDMFCDAAVRIYERVRGPRALVVGPWMHSAPDDAPDEPVDATALALRWWSRWLGPRPGAAADPAVTVYVQGAEPGWRALPEWPPRGRSRTLAGPVAPAPRDPTVGTLSGLWGIPNGGFGRPLDQHADDARAVTLTGPPLTEPLLLAGRPEVTVTGAGEPDRLVVKLTDVEPDGRSTLITGGILTGSDRVLDPTCYRVAEGHRLRVVVADSAFPRIWPAPGARGRLELHRLEVRLPVAATAGEPVAVERPSPPPDDPPWVTDTPRWEITREPISDRVAVVVGGRARGGPAGRWRRAAAGHLAAGRGRPRHRRPPRDQHGHGAAAVRRAGGRPGRAVPRRPGRRGGRTVRVDDVAVAERHWRLPGRRNPAAATSAASSSSPEPARKIAR